jgi:hypothetical protein
MRLVHGDSLRKAQNEKIKKMAAHTTGNSYDNRDPSQQKKKVTWQGEYLEYPLRFSLSMRTDVPVNDGRSPSFTLERMFFIMKG